MSITIRQENVDDTKVWYSTNGTERLKILKLFLCSKKK